MRFDNTFMGDRWWRRRRCLPRRCTNLHKLCINCRSATKITSRLGQILVIVEIFCINFLCEMRLCSRFRCVSICVVNFVAKPTGGGVAGAARRGGGGAVQITVPLTLLLSLSLTLSLFPSLPPSLSLSLSLTNSLFLSQVAELQALLAAAEAALGKAKVIKDVVQDVG